MKRIIDYLRCATFIFICCVSDDDSLEWFYEFGNFPNRKIGAIIASTDVVVSVMYSIRLRINGEIHSNNQCTDENDKQQRHAPFLAEHEENFINGRNFRVFQSHNWAFENWN